MSSTRRAILSAALALGSALVGFVAVLMLRTARFRAPESAGAAVQQAGAPIEPADSGAIGRMSEAVRYRTISYFDSSARLSEFARFRSFLVRAYPLVHTKLRREVLDSATLVFTWKGADTSLAPVLLLGHQDVVPVEPGTEKDWKHGAFSGDVADGFIWGRGTLDDKFSVLGNLEAVESLLRKNYQPRRTVILAFGYTEELGGPSAVRTAQLLQQRGIKPWFVMDEGGALGDSIVPGVSSRVALIGISEKGYLSLRLTAHGQGGHSSMPPSETAVSILGGALDRVQRTPLPARMNDATRAMFNTVGPLMTYSRRFVMANMWLFEPVVQAGMAKNPSGNAVVRTTTAVTMVSGGIKDNVVPSAATAVVNFRLMPGDSVRWVTERIKQIVNDSRIDVEPIEGSAREASAVSPTDNDAYAVLAQSIREAYPGTTVSPFLLMGGTDSRNFYLVSSNVYRFAPILVDGDELKIVHGTNERVKIGSYLAAIGAYRRIIENATR
ncbi:MAG TPA: M20 family peptidase [Gemmatimonadaceae bacterium]|nr:M20 family peptidase [Gemmatimonadaceae bacterium]